MPEGVNVDIPLQSYFRLNAPGAGQFEHTLDNFGKRAYCHFIEGCSAPRYNVVNLHAGAVELFVAKIQLLRYSTIENWSRNMYNLNTKRAIVEKNGKIQWISGSFGQKKYSIPFHSIPFHSIPFHSIPFHSIPFHSIPFHSIPFHSIPFHSIPFHSIPFHSMVSMLYPTSVLVGEGSTSEFTGISFAGEGQNLDTGAQVVHSAPHTNSTITLSQFQNLAELQFTGDLVEITENAKNSKNTTSCESLMLDEWVYGQIQFLQ